ncbi:hypothetical protein [Blastopirellula retiformator]|uniref:Uncharacterized protein n=1 Tax=Blastopirellula retiformator TaxID=2527970 RepID=A0A5C5V0R8_9BACT|nr:hypothetical protein [Blastopirellula retiformator]TWT31981.1 hypothetical protein Enr8_39070 [Blastopirellula retiformator]
MRNNSIAALILLSGVFSLVGCSSGTKTGEVQIEGAMTIDGVPIPNGSMSFVSVDKSTPTGGGVIKDGRYTAFTMPGEKKVLVVGNKVVGQEKLYDTPDSPTRDKYESIVPARYNALQTTPLTVTIDGPQQDLDFDLDSKK